MLPSPKFDLRAAFEKVLDLGPIDRAHYLRELQFQSPLHYHELRNLLSAHEGPSEMFEAEGGIWSQISPADLTGRRFGAYSIVREIGRGGMGTVYEATRADDAFHKTVAIKLISIMVLSDSFRRERQILAQLEHPNIARLLDGGATDDGMLYLIMEYVDGVPLDQYIEDHHLPVDDILRLFLQVMSAVSFAHRNLIVHRDLKPSNILVTHDGIVKLLDFGIAKVLSPNRDETATVSVRLTPEFASPEQIRGGQISTVSDIYSLGVLLFHTLTGGVRPYRTTSPAVADIMQSVLDSQPPRPSAVCSPLRSRKVKGDLDNIILKAMAKEPERRYVSVDQLREDIERHLSGRPILAKGDDWAYTTSKFIGRHSFAVIASLIIVISIAVGIVSTLRQRAAAEARYQSIRSLATSILSDVNETLKSVPGALPARKQAVLAVVKQLEALAERSGDDPSLNEDLAGAYEQTAEIMASLFEDPKDGATLASPALARAIALRQKLPPTVRYSDSVRQLGNNQIQMGEIGRAIDSYRRAITVAELLPNDDARARAIGLAHTNLCTANLLRNRPADAEGDCWAAVGMLRGMENVIARLRYARALTALRRPDEAQPQWQEAVSGLDPLDPKSAPVAEELLTGLEPGRLRAEVLWKRGVLFTRAGQRDQGLESFEQSLRAAGDSRPPMRQVVAFAEACQTYTDALESIRSGQVREAEEGVRSAQRRLAESTPVAASLLRAELSSTLAKQPR